MARKTKLAVQTWIVAVPETAGSALYGMVDVLAAAGNIWHTPVGTEPQQRLFDVRIVSPFARAVSVRQKNSREP